MRKTILFGLDGASFELLMPWIKEGKLPIFQKLIQTGIHGTLLSTIPCITCPALPSLYTGKSPGNTGIFNFVRPGGRVVSSGDIKDPTIWQVADKYGKKSLIVNLRTTYPPEKLNGIMICSIHGPYGLSKDLDYTYPKEIKQRAEGFAIDHDEFLKNIRMKIMKNKREGYENIGRLVKLRYQVFKQLALEDDYDFAFYWMEHTDTMHHLCWRKKESILRFYQEIVEKILEDLINTFKDHNILIVSDHGVARPLSYNFHINAWLNKQGYLSLKGSNATQALLKIIALLTMRLVPKQALRQLTRLKKDKSRMNPSGNSMFNEDTVLPDKSNRFVGINWSNTVAYSDINWGIRINKKVVPQAKYEEVREEIIQKLQKLVDEKQETIIQNAWKREDIYSGKYLPQIPDIVFLPKNKYKVNFIPLNRITSRIYIKPKIATHCYARKGIFIAHGPDIRQGFEIDELQIYDIAPIILFMLGIEVPNDLEGKVIKDIFKKDSELFQRKVRYTDKAFQRHFNIRELTKEEQKGIKKKLKSLGYID